MSVKGLTKRGLDAETSSASARSYSKHPRLRASYSGHAIALILLGLLLDPALTQDLTPAPASSGDSPSSSQGSGPSTAAEDGGGGGGPTPDGNATAYPLNTVSASSLKGKCRDRHGWYSPPEFSLTTCGKCVGYIYDTTKTKTVHVRFNEKFTVLLLLNSTGKLMDYVMPDVDNASFVDRVCQVMEADGIECQRWVSCCKSAQQCCQDQLSAQSSTATAVSGGGADGDGGVSGGSESSGYCPATWDGFGCWEDTVSGTTVSRSCPNYVSEHSSDGELAKKQCLQNGTWYISPESNYEWTDYTACVVFDNYWVLFWVGLSCNLVSLLLLLPACFIFLYFRSLRSQHRIKLHVCLFISYIITNILMIIWEVAVVRDRLVSAGSQSVLHKNPLGCRFLHALTRYAWTANFMWMFLEGLHLYRLMVHAFAAPSSLLFFYIGGFSLPAIPTVIYSIIRGVKDDLNTRCWVPNAGGFEWVIYVPIIFFLVGNIFFLCKILYVMVSQLQSHPNEPSSYRRALKAAAILIPLFGLQALMVIVRPQPVNHMYEVFSRIVTNTQGALVAIGFCYLNGEVLTLIRKNLPGSLRSRGLLGRSDNRGTVLSTQFTTDGPSCTTMHTRTSASGPTSGGGQGGNSTAGYIPLSTIGDEGTTARPNAESFGSEDKEKLRNGFA